jgi:ABC-type polysaccharide/polyol phosphate export permease
VINLALSLVPLVLLMLVAGGQFSWALLVLPLSALLLCIFCYGVGLILSASAVFFRDVVYTWQVLLIALMYLTPLFYPEQIVPDRFKIFVYLNPVYHLLQLFRAPIYAGTLPDAVNVLASTGFAAGIVIIGWWFFEASRKRFVAYL